MQSAGVLILGHPLIACMLLILFAYFLKGSVSLSVSEASSLKPVDLR